MAKEETTVTDLAVRSAVESAIANQKRSKKVYGDYTPARGVILSDIVMNVAESIDRAFSRERCHYGDLETAKRYTKEYLVSCSEHQLLPTVQGWSMALGISRPTIYTWFNRRDNKEFTEFLDFIRDAIMESMSQNAFQRTVDNVWAIFYGKNFYGMTDKTEISVSTPINPLGETTSPEELQQKYLSAVTNDNGEEEP